MQARTHTPDAEVPIDVDLARALLEEQHPDLASLEIRAAVAGWDNAMFRLGEELALRLPRRGMAAPLLRNEQRWLAEVTADLPLPTPVPLRIGEPGCGYPWAWSVVPWLAGRSVNREPLRDDQGEVVGRFLRALHRPAPPEAPPNPLRGVPLENRAAVVEEQLERLRRDGPWIDPTIDRVWAAALETTPAPESCWIHGDLHARNALAVEGRLTAVIDWGDITSGDVATDLACVWALLGSRAGRQEALATYDPDRATLRRAKGWAVFFAAVLLDTGRRDNPSHARMGEAIFSRLSADGRDEG